LGSSSEALDGILGFGQSNTSVLSQLASAGKVKKVFSHCLDTIRGGGIFAIGDVAQPKVKTTPLVPNQCVIFLTSNYFFKLAESCFNLFVAQVRKRG
jgi:Xylanase inhibitor N-terminal